MLEEIVWLTYRLWIQSYDYFKFQIHYWESILGRISRAVFFISDAVIQQVQPCLRSKRGASQRSSPPKPVWPEAVHEERKQPTMGRAGTYDGASGAISHADTCKYSACLLVLEAMATESLFPQ